MIMYNNGPKVIEALKHGFYGSKVLVFGDLMLDYYLWGDVSRISPEAPVPVVRVKNQTETAGGSANVALNLKKLGLNVSCFGFIGRGSPGLHLIDCLRAESIDTDSMIKVPGRPTTTKTRIIAKNQQMLRYDIEELSSVPDKYIQLLKEHAKPQINKDLGAVVLSDYAKGALPQKLCRWIINQSNKAGVPVFVDPKGFDYEKYSGATLLSPNRYELAAISGISSDNIKKLIRAGKELRQKFNLEYLLITRGEQGMTLVSETKNFHMPSLALEVYDVSGAGDTVLATIVAGRLAELDLEDCLHLANQAAGIVVSKVGTAPIELGELAATVNSDLKT
jgi:D-beta-D-heptose 7-phosphate kinase / D-beta-D-heptose 1-phosphate adenosyltransferase